MGYIASNQFVTTILTFQNGGVKQPFSIWKDKQSQPIFG